MLWLSTHAEVADLGPAYVTIGEAQWERRQNWSGDPSRIATLPYVEVARPVFVRSTRLTWDDLAGMSWDGLKGRTWDSLKDGL